jgi:steroid delta-isomerase-like uncharacterized protein
MAPAPSVARDWPGRVELDQGEAMADDPRTVNRRFNEEVINDHRPEAIDELVSEDIVDHVPLPGQAPGREGVKQLMAMFGAAFPDMRIEIVTEVAEGERIAQVARLTGTHRGDFMGLPATGKQVSVLAADFGIVRDGRFVEHWGFIDQAGLMQQLGIGPGGPGG